MNNLVGRRFGRLTAIAIADRQNSHIRWRCACDCGREHIVKGLHLINGSIHSCGCYNHDRLIERNTTHGLSRTPEHYAWVRMQQRCYNPKNLKYPQYGARGITVCAEWREDFTAFLAHVGPRPSAAHSIDRIDNNRDYEPGNVRWATRAEQAINKQATGRFLDLDNRPMSLRAMAAHLALSRSALTWMLRSAGVAV